MQGLELYNKVRQVPPEAKKPIGGGRLKGMTDINPMWRLKILTEQFGPCGLGWYYEITDQWIEEGTDGEKVAFTNISLYVKYGEEWSKPITGTGGSSFIAKERSGLYTSDECFKMALTDAISVACKSLGVAADVYFEKDRTKYDSGNEPEGTSKASSQENGANGQGEHKLSEKQVSRLFGIAKSKGVDFGDVKKAILKYGVTNAEDLSKQQYDELCARLEKAGA